MCGCPAVVELKMTTCYDALFYYYYYSVFVNTFCHITVDIQYNAPCETVCALLHTIMYLRMCKCLQACNLANNSLLKLRKNLSMYLNAE